MPLPLSPEELDLLPGVASFAIALEAAPAQSNGATSGARGMPFDLTCGCAAVGRFGLKGRFI
jgi:hypothetical protein